MQRRGMRVYGRPSFTSESCTQWPPRLQKKLCRTCKEVGVKERVGTNYDTCLIQDRDTDVIQKWFHRFTGVPGVWDKYILRPSPKELFKICHLLSFPDPARCKEGGEV